MKNRKIRVLVALTIPVLVLVLVAISIVQADVPRGDLLHREGNAEVYYYNHPCVSIVSHLAQHENDEYLGGDCPFPTPTSPDSFNTYLFLPVIGKNPPNECLVPGCVPFVRGE
jgi:hypothetical protein